MMSNSVDCVHYMMCGLSVTPKVLLVISHNDICHALNHAHGTIVWSHLRSQGHLNMMRSNVIFIHTNRNPCF